MQPAHPYVQLGGVFVSVNLSPLAVAWLLYSNNKDFRRLGFGRRDLLNFFLRRLLLSYRRRKVVELPVEGNLCLRANRGYLVFDFQRRTVTRILTREPDRAAVSREIEQARAIGLHGFAPLVRRWNVAERWYEVDYLEGDSGWSIAPPDPAIFLGKYNRYIAPVIEGIITLEEPLSMNLTEYMHSTLMPLLERELAAMDGLPASDKAYVRSFVASTVDRLLGEKNRSVHLTLSHGDFLPYNIIRTVGGIKVIDWEHIGKRSALHDLYNYFYTRMYFSEAIGLVGELGEAISSLRNRLSRKCPELAHQIVPLASVYRWLFYLERICVILEREPTEARANVLRRTIDLFTRYERSLDAGSEVGVGVRTYSTHFQDYSAVQHYEGIYEKDSYDSFIWGLEKRLLVDVFTRLGNIGGGLRHLDFACGTGRIISAVEPLIKESVGLDISEKMLSVAKQKLANAKLFQGDILTDPQLVGFDYDVITAFRFFRNAEDTLRIQILKSLASRLRGQNSRLIFNVHWFEHGKAIRRLKNHHRPEPYGKWLSYSEISRLINNAGLEIESCHGFGLLPGRLHRGRLRALARLGDTLAARVSILKYVSDELVFVCKPRAPKPNRDSSRHPTTRCQ